MGFLVLVGDGAFVFVHAILLLPEVPLRVELEKVQNFARQLSTQIDDAF